MDSTNSSSLKPCEKGGKGSTRLQFIAAFSATIVFVIAGNFIGWPSPSIPKLENEDSHIPITSSQSAWMASLLHFGTFFVPLPIGYIVDILGRKFTLFFAAVPFIASWLMIIFATSVVELYVSRFLAGVGLGVAFTVIPMYTAEIAEDRIRGAVGTIFQFMMNLGTLFQYSIGPYVSFTTLASISLVFPVLFLITFVWMPETPYFLMAKNRRDDAEKSLMRLRGTKNFENIQEELDKILKTVEMQMQEKGSFRDLTGTFGTIKALFISMGLIVTQNFSGIAPMLSYISVILLKSGTSIDANISAIIFGVVQLIVSIVSAGLVDKLGRRTLLLVSSTGCTVALTIEGMYFYLDRNGYDGSVSIDWMPLTFLLIYIITYTLGLGPVVWIVAGEIFPSNIKGKAIAIVSMTNSLCAFTVTKLFQVISDGLGDFVAFWILAGWCAVATICIALMVPETKGKSLLQITEEMNETGIVLSKKKHTEINSNRNDSG